MNPGRTDICRILVVQTSFLGDTVLATPVLSTLQQAYPEAEIVVVTTPAAAPLWQGHPAISEVITYDKRGADRGIIGLVRLAKRLRLRQFDVAYALQRSYRTALLLWWAKIPRRIGFADSRLAFLFSRTVVRNLAEHEVLRSLSILSADIPRERWCTTIALPAPKPLHPNKDSAALKVVVIAPGSVWATKRWTVAGFSAVRAHFYDRGYRIMVVGSEPEREICAAVAPEAENFAGKLSLQELMAAVSDAAIVICNDSLVQHLASAYGRPCVAIFCATSPRFGFGPWHEAGAVVEVRGLPCKPCRRHGSHSCPTGTNACMTGVLPEQVIAAAERQMAIAPAIRSSE